MTQHWLMKTEPESFSIADLQRSPRQTTFWDGVRNYQARNFMRAMRRGDLVLFYHSNADPPAVVGVAEVAAEAYPDHTALDPENHHFDPKATPESPIWEMVDIRLKEIFARPATLDTLRGRSDLAGMELLRRGSRLSVQPVSEAHFAVIEQIARSQAIEESVDAGAESSAKKKTTKKSTKKATKKPAKKSRKKVGHAGKKPNKIKQAKPAVKKTKKSKKIAANRP